MLFKFTRTNVIHARIYLYVNEYEFEFVAFFYDLTVSVKLTDELIINVTVYTLNFTDLKFNLMTKVTAVCNIPQHVALSPFSSSRME